MSEPKFTPGPWSTGHLVGSVFAGERAIAHALTSDRERGAADARLIAAAPDFYEFAVRFLDFFNMETDAYVEKYGTGDSTRTLGALARAALKKARGE
jgi:hypothetical protein